jgi:hypothetical protein
MVARKFPEGNILHPLGSNLSKLGTLGSDFLLAL